jgi:hypothetical protein
VKKLLETELGLTVHPEKSRVVHVQDGFEFLGYLFKGQYRRPKDRKIDEFKQQVREITSRNQTTNLKTVIAKLNPLLRGWGNYFCYGQVKTRMQALDRWIQRRLRAVQLRSWRHVGQLHRMLRRMGVQDARLPDLRMTRWASSVHWMAHMAIPQALFTSLGLVSLVKIYAMKMG